MSAIGKRTNRFPIEVSFIENEHSDLDIKKGKNKITMTRKLKNHNFQLKLSNTESKLKYLQINVDIKKTTIQMEQQVQ